MRIFSAWAATLLRPTRLAEVELFSGEFDLRDRVHEINLKAAQLAKEVAQQFSTKDQPRFVAGSMGPTTKLPSLGHIGFDAMVESYEEQAAALIEGGVDVLLIETAQDLLQAKIATIGVLEAMRKAGSDCPCRCRSPCRNPARCCSAPKSVRP